MNATEMNHTLDFMETFDPPAYKRICYAGQMAAKYALTWTNMNVQCVCAASLIAAELQCIVEAMRYERMGGVFLAVKDGK